MCSLDSHTKFDRKRRSSSSLRRQSNCGSAYARGLADVKPSEWCWRQRPELNGQDNIWQSMRQNWLSNRVFKTFDDIVDHC